MAKLSFSDQSRNVRCLVAFGIVMCACAAFLDSRVRSFSGLHTRPALVSTPIPAYFAGNFRPVSNKNGPGAPCSSSELLSDYSASRFVPDGSNDSMRLGDCERSYDVPLSLLEPMRLQNMRCTSALANAVSSPETCTTIHGHASSATTADKPSGFPRASICVFYLNYRNLDNLMTSVRTHTLRSHNPDVVSHTVLTMEEDQNEVETTRRALARLADVYHIKFPPGTKGGDPIPAALHLVSLASSCPVTVVSDSDAFMLADAWDVRLLSEFVDPELALLAGNPRHHSHGGSFWNMAEWNWMAYRTQALAGLLIGGPFLVDPEHYYTPCVRRIPNTHIKLFQDAVRPYDGKAATIVVDDSGFPWIMHLFYSSRHRNEADGIKAEAARNSLSSSELAQLQRTLTSSRCVVPY